MPPSLAHDKGTRKVFIQMGIDGTGNVPGEIVTPLGFGYQPVKNGAVDDGTIVRPIGVAESVCQLARRTSAVNGMFPPLIGA